MFIIIDEQNVRLNSHQIVRLHWTFVSSEESRSEHFRDFCKFFVETYNGRIFKYATFANLIENLWSNYESCV